MSIAYDRYIHQHKNNVYEAWNWLKVNLPQELLPQDPDIYALVEHQCQFAHDDSKTSPEEYNAYDQYFYGNRSYEVVESFKYAWLHHLHNNPHHWQYWVLINDDKDSGETCLEMPENYVFEMICDWWSFSWRSGNLEEIFEWYNEGKEYRKINEITLNKIENILSAIKEILDKEKQEMGV